jgi:hypothetical protein
MRSRDTPWPPSSPACGLRTVARANATVLARGQTSNETRDEATDETSDDTRDQPRVQPRVQEGDETSGETMERSRQGLRLCG